MQKRISYFVIVVFLAVLSVVGIAAGQDGGAPFTTWLPIAGDQGGRSVFEMFNRSAHPPAEVSDDDVIAPPSEEQNEEYRRQVLESLKDLKITYASGKETAGGTITVNGKEISLPSNVYVEAHIVGVTCIEGLPCPRTPAYALRYLDRDASIAISSVDGKITDAVLDEEKAVINRAEFQWLYNAVEGK